MGGLAQINCMKQFTQFGMQKEMHLGGALFELESVRAVPPEAQAGILDDGVVVGPAQCAGGRGIRRGFPQGDRQDPDRTALVRLCCGAVGAAGRRKGQVAGRPEAVPGDGRDGTAARCRTEPGKVFYRAGDHELMANIFVRRRTSAEGQSGRCVHRDRCGAREKAAGPVAETGCKMVHPAYATP